ncbi:MAG: hypothetical protein DIJKHBIC_00368 [Thermoanaerobaculia bacterium]|nr:hypothetical protein [Thermoanaerobaculia bacterium]
MSLDKSKYLDILMRMTKVAPQIRIRLKVDPVLVARICHALSDATRLAILDRLRNGDQCVCDLVDVLGAGQSRLSFHLKTLKDAGLVRDRKDGRWVHYSLNTETFLAIEAFLASFRKAEDATEAQACCKT